MQRVTGIGGIFIKAKDPVALRAWYQKHLGIEVQEWGGAVFTEPGMTVWSVSPSDTEYFAPSTASFMVNYRVADVAALLEVLRQEGCEVVGNAQDSEFGKFGWVMDPEGNKVELWQPPA